MLGKPPNEGEDDKFEELFDKFMAMKGIVNNAIMYCHIHVYYGNRNSSVFTTRATEGVC